MDDGSNFDEIRHAVRGLCSDFSLDYWRKCDLTGTYPQEFVDAVNEAGWLGIATPEAYGGSGLGIQEAAVLMQTISESGAGFSGASAVHLSIFGLQPAIAFGTEEQKQRMLPPLITGRERTCFAVTEPDAGLDTLSLTTRAEREDDHYRVNGQKVWTSNLRHANKMLLLARTTPIEECARRSDGLSLFYCTIDRERVIATEIHKMGRAAVDSNVVFFEDFLIPSDDRIGEEGRGFEYILHGLNPERILLGAEAVGLGRAALRLATNYASDRRVFGRPIGQNQGIQHPLAHCWMELEAANLMVFRAAKLYDAKKPCGAEANAAKYLSAEAGFNSCQQAVMTHGGFGYAHEYHVERFLRESFIPRIAPVSRELILCYIAERVLGLPKSY